jgi:cysteine desulfuration protein SufE
VYPAVLQEIVAFFESLPEPERREALIDYADAAASCAPAPGEPWTVIDIRHDAECTDKVGIFLRLDAAGRVHFAVELGPKVQTLTRAMTTLLCRGLNGCTPAEVLALPADFVPRLVGTELVRLRSRTIYYVLERMRQAVRQLPV